MGLCYVRICQTLLSLMLFYFTKNYLLNLTQSSAFLKFNTLTFHCLRLGKKIELIPCSGKDEKNTQIEF